MRSITLLKRITVLSALCIAASPLVPGHASAGWPPPPNATAMDMADPANWPNDPGYGYSANNDGQWNLYSFIPTVAKLVRKEETASGMSVDLAWSVTTGDPSVVIAITDSGIKWDEDDLLDKAWLNVKELANHKPTHADGSACGGTGEFAGFDCNGDGIFSVSDYKDTLSLTPAASARDPPSDRNGNGKLDAGGIIQNFSDGLDDDGHGHVERISGGDVRRGDHDTCAATGAHGGESEPNARRAPATGRLQKRGSRIHAQGETCGNQTPFHEASLVHSLYPSSIIQLTS